MTKQNTNDCCAPKINSERTGFLWGIVYGLLPHTFCILFVLLSIIGATSGAVFLKKFLFVPHLFLYLIILSFCFATISAIFYLKRANSFSGQGIKIKWKYLTILYSTTIIINLLFAYLILPAAAGIRQSENNIASSSQPASVENGVQIIRMDQLAGGYQPSSFTVKVGTPVKWIITSHKDTCAASIRSPKLGIQKTLDPGENVIEFAPKEAGTYKFTCFMGMYSGTIYVTN